MKKLIITAFVCFTSIITLAQNDTTRTNKTEYIIDEFHKVVNNSVADIVINKGDNYTITFLCDNNTLKTIEYSVTDGTLEISNKENFNSSNQFCKIEITTPSLSEFVNEGVGKSQIYTTENRAKIVNSGVGNCIVTADCPIISIENSGVGVIKVSGSSTDTRIFNSGAGSIQAKNLISDRASVTNCGVGNVEVYAESAIHVANTGLGKVTVYGSPKQQSITTNNGDVNTYIVPANEKTKKVRRVYPYIGAKWGFNNYLENGKFAQGMQKVKPWGSWEAGVYIGSSFRFGKWFRLPAEISFTWFNFKFSEPSVRYATDSSRQPYLYYDNNPDLTYMKSKLSAPYVNFELCPTFVIIPTHLSIGVGGYVGYNLGGRNKYKYLTNGEKYKDHIKASCFEAFRYGVKAEVNLRFISFYATYDLSNVYCNLTADNNVLKVNPVCFGIELTFAR
ncbi:MAG: DUF2807 domain-containing protein [Bacteroidales bacterium]|nr:DUF2807 domain-containing protein [Bacteroidales bacterium]